jgi:hypothetical protein
MGNYDKLLLKIIQGKSDANIPFSALCTLLKRLNFTERIRGDHHIFSKAEVIEIINLQPIGSKSKPYQVKQIRNLIVHYGLTLEENDDK